MADEMTMDVVDNGGMASDFMSAYSQVVDDDGAPIDDGGAAEPQQQAQPQQQQPTQGNQQPPVPQMPQQQQQQPVQGQQQPQGNQEITGFASRFLKQDETGNSVFDAEAAHGFLFPQDGSGFAYRGPNFSQAMQQQAQQAQPQQGEVPQAPTDPKEAYRQERQQQIENWKNQMLVPIQAMREQLGQNIDPATKTFLDHQERIAVDKINRELLPDWELENRDKIFEQREQERTKEARMKQLSEKAAFNQSRLAQALGGEEQLGKFFFGETQRGPDGRVVSHTKGPGEDAVMHLFQLTNPDKINWTGEKLGNAMNEWWTEVSANEQNLALLYKMGRAQLVEELWPQLVGKIGAAKEAEIRGQRRTSLPQPSGVSRAQPTEMNEQQQLNQYFGFETV